MLGFPPAVSVLSAWLTISKILVCTDHRNLSKCCQLDPLCHSEITQGYFISRRKTPAIFSVQYYSSSSTLHYLQIKKTVLTVYQKLTKFKIATVQGKGRTFRPHSGELQLKDLDFYSCPRYECLNLAHFLMGVFLLCKKWCDNNDFH